MKAVKMQFMNYMGFHITLDLFMVATTSGKIEYIISKL